MKGTMKYYFTVLLTKNLTKIYVLDMNLPLNKGIAKFAIYS